MWFALEEQQVFDKSVSKYKNFKKQYKVKILRFLDQEAMDSKQEQQRQLYLHKLNGLCSDFVTFPDTRASRWDHLRKELDATNAYFFSILREEFYEFTDPIDYYSFRHNRILKKSVIKEFPVLQQFNKPYYDILEVCNRNGKLLYFLAQNSRPYPIPHKAMAKTPFGNAEHSSDQSIESNILNYFVVSIFSEVIIRISHNNLDTGCIAPVFIGKFRIGRIHLNPFGELLLMCETVHPGNRTHDFIVKYKPSSHADKRTFVVHEILTMNIIATISSKVWHGLMGKAVDDSTPTFGLCFKQNVNIIDKSLIFGAAIIIVHEYYKARWSGNLQKPKKVSFKKCKVNITEHHELDISEICRYTIPEVPCDTLKNDFVYET